MTDTKSKSVKKPADHKPAADDVVSVTYENVTYQVRKRGLTNLRLMDLLERGQVTSALRLLIGDDKFDEFMDSVDEDGIVDPEHASKVFELITEKAGAKN